MSETNSAPEAGVQRNNRRQLLLIALIAIVSISGSYALFFGSRDGGVWGTTNQGEFVQPPIAAADLALTDATGTAFATQGVWWLWLVGDGACTAECEEALHNMRAVHVLLHREADRLRRAYVLADVLTDVRTNVLTDGPTGEPAFAADYPKLGLWRTAQPLAPGVYIVDPHGNLVLRYTLEQMGKPVQKDLKRLLKVSQIG